MENFEIKLIGPPVTVGRAAAGCLMEWALGFGCHAFVFLVD